MFAPWRAASAPSAAPAQNPSGIKPSASGKSASDANAVLTDLEKEMAGFHVAGERSYYTWI